MSKHLLVHLFANVVAGGFGGTIVGIVCAAIEYMFLHFNEEIPFSSYVWQVGFKDYSSGGGILGCLGGMLTFWLTTVWPRLTALRESAVLWMLVGGCVCVIGFLTALGGCPQFSTLGKVFLFAVFCGLGAAYGATLAVVAQWISGELL